MTGQFYEPPTNDLIACDDGVHFVLLEKANSQCDWVMRRHPDGGLVSVRKATAHELEHAKARQHLRAGVAQLSEVNQKVMRWPLKGFLPGVEGMSKAVLRPVVVLASDYDAALAREAALQQRLNEADQRVDELRGQIAKLNEEAEFCDKVGQGIEDGLRAKLDTAIGLLSRANRAAQGRGASALKADIDAFLSQLAKDSPEVGS